MMGLWFPKTDYGFFEVADTRVGRFKMWVHYDIIHVLHKWFPRLVTWETIRCSRRWLYGPNANYENLYRLLAEATKKVQSR